MSAAYLKLRHVLRSDGVAFKYGWEHFERREWIPELVRLGVLPRSELQPEVVVDVDADNAASMPRPERRCRRR